MAANTTGNVAFLLTMLALEVWLILTIINYNFTPYLPEFSLVSASTAVENISEPNHRVTMDMNVSFVVYNPNKAAMVFQDIEALAFQYGDQVPITDPAINNATKINFEQLGTRKSTEWFRLQNTTAAIDVIWVDKGDTHDDPNVYEKSGKSLALQFELRGHAVYPKDNNGSPKHRIPIKVACDGEVDILFSLNTTRSFSFEPMAPQSCEVYGEWRGPWGGVSNSLNTIFVQGYCTIFLPLTYFILWHS
ncbi:hypothetical protein PanWU01x14_130080 [Parasponia andersonii]|uniref:Uncharacterized protein n=1 Tax=Parasponia andersonii TaxID=3476 RepID=A0A2P5CRS0_PARAD|nr:hypothetical protein PanWU01x14_130080 [Parasponia andersonii]